MHAPHTLHNMEPAVYVAVPDFESQSSGLGLLLNLPVEPFDFALKKFSKSTPRKMNFQRCRNWPKFMPVVKIWHAREFRPVTATLDIKLKGY